MDFRLIAGHSPFFSMLLGIEAYPIIINKIHQLVSDTCGRNCYLLISRDPSELVRGRLELYFSVGYILYLDRLKLDPKYGLSKVIVPGFCPGEG